MSKKLYLLFISILCAFGTPKERAALDNLLESVNWGDSFQAAFTYYTTLESNNQELEKSKPIQGKIGVKGSKYHLVLDDIQEVICNGQFVWSYLPQANEVQIAYYDPEEEAQSPIKLLTLYKANFSPISLTKCRIDNQACSLVEWVSKDPESLFINLKLIIEPQKKHIKSLEALDQDGYWHHFLIKSLKPKKEWPDSYFEFDPALYEGIEVVDLCQ